MASRSDHRKAMRTCSHKGDYSPYCPPPEVSPTGFYFLHRLQTVKSRKPDARKVTRPIPSPPLRKPPQNDLNYMIAEHCCFATRITATNTKFALSTLFTASPSINRDPMRHSLSTYVPSHLIEPKLHIYHDLLQSFRFSYALPPHPPNPCVSERSPKLHHHS